MRWRIKRRSDMTTDLQKLLAAYEGFENNSERDLFRALVTRLDALTEAKGAGPRVFRKGDRVRIGPFAQSIAAKYIGQTVTLRTEHNNSLWTVESDDGQCFLLRVRGIGCEIEPVAAAAPLASGNLAAVTAEPLKIVQGGVWYVREEMYDSAMMQIAALTKSDAARPAKPGEYDAWCRENALIALLDELTPSWREETDDPLAAVRGICAEKDRAWTAANETVIDMRKREVERDEARAKLAEAERERDEARKSASAMHRRAQAAEASAKQLDPNRLRNIERKHATQLGRWYENLAIEKVRLQKLYADRVAAQSAALTAAESALAGAQSEADQLAKDRYAEAMACDEAAKLLPYVPQGGDNRHSRARDAWLADYRSRRSATNENIQRGGSVNAAESQHGSGHREQVRASQAEGSIGRGQDRVVTADLRASGAGFDGAAPAGTGIGGRAHALGDGELLGERGDCSRVGSGGTVRGVTDFGAAPSPAAPDFERRVEALSDDFASGGVNWNSLARRALKAEDEAKRLRDMIAEYVAAKSAGTSGPTSPSAVRLYRAERALKDAAQPEAGR